MGKLFLYISIIPKLGILNVIYVIWYRLSLKTGIRKLWFKTKIFNINEPFYLEIDKKKADYPEEWKNQLLTDANKIVSGEFRYYAFHWKNIGTPPDWFVNPFNQTSYPDTHKHWTELPDFSKVVGDIKNIWEASRFEWVVTFARAYAISGNSEYLNTLNKYLEHWIRNNPLNIGPNWKCGQEVSVRIFNLINAAFILNQHNNPSDTLKEIVYNSLLRIRKNIRYAIAQDNNHGTSEAAALFIGGGWLEKLNLKDYPQSIEFAKTGRYWLENRVNKLIAKDGSFSQHSVTYHRVMLDTLSFAEFWRQQLGGSSFSKEFYQKSQAATKWLYFVTDEYSGNAPNLGSNDGAMFLNCHTCDYRDFRPSLQFAIAVFQQAVFFENGPWNEPLYWFEINNSYLKKSVLKKQSDLMNGYLVVQNQKSWAMVRLPYFKFRPAHNDVFHFDLWFRGKNICHDTGSYSYNPDIEEGSIDLKSVHYHNTVSFDGHEQMPKISRFLLGRWIKPYRIGSLQKINDQYYWSGAYTDSMKNSHQRKIIMQGSKWEIEDRVSGKFNQAFIGYNLINDDYHLKENEVIASWGKIVITGSSDIKLVDSFTSEYYMEKHACKRLIISTSSGHTVKTTFVLVS